MRNELVGVKLELQNLTSMISAAVQQQHLSAAASNADLAYGSMQLLPQMLMFKISASMQRHLGNVSLAEQNNVKAQIEAMSDHGVFLEKVKLYYDSKRFWEYFKQFSFVPMALYMEMLHMK